MEVKNKNRKPDSWYEEFCKFLYNKIIENCPYINLSIYSIKKMIREDIKVDFFQIIWDRVKGKHVINKGEFPYGVDLSDIPEDIILQYRKAEETNQLRWFIGYQNSLEGNIENLKQCKKIIEKIKSEGVKKSIDTVLKNCIGFLSQYLVTNQIHYIKWVCEDLIKYERQYKEEIIDNFEEKIGSIEKIEYFKENFSFEYSEREVLDLILKEVNWRDIERDIEIYMERQKGRLLEDIAGDYKTLKLKAIGNICTKVKKAINHYKGKLFERRYFQHLKSLNKFDKVVWDGSSGKPDIFAFKDNEIHIFSLKNLKIDRKRFVIKKQDLEPEFKRAYNGLLENDDIFLKLVVFDNMTNKVIERDLDFRNPEDVIINS
ncbi:hypothetical protein ES702_03439 [subsurface metagenome]